MLPRAPARAPPKAKPAPPAMPALTASRPPPSPSSGSKTSRRSPISQPTSLPSTGPSTPRNCSPSSAWPSLSRRSLRAARLESGLFTNCLNEALDTNDRPFTPMSPGLAGDGDIEITRAQNRNYALAHGFHRMARQSNSWSLFLRYQAQAERQYRRAVEEFDRLKALRAELPNEPILEVQSEENKTACAPPDELISTPQANPEPPVDSLSITTSSNLRSRSSCGRPFGLRPTPWSPFLNRPPQRSVAAMLHCGADHRGVSSARFQERRGAARRRKPIVCRGAVAVGNYLSEAHTHRDVFGANALFRRHRLPRLQL
jgi:hypothetical protein